MVLAFLQTVARTSGIDADLQQVYSGIIQACRELGYRVELLHQPTPTWRLGTTLDGLICVSYGDADIAALTEVLDPVVPVVLVNRFSELDGVHYVTIDHRAAARAAVDYLARLGHRRIAVGFSGLQQGYVQQRLQGCRDALVFHDVLPDERLFMNFASPSRAGEALGIHAH